MGKQLLGYGPHGLSLEINPWSRPSVDSVLLHRGAIVSGWASVETTLIEVAIRASHHPAYIGHREFFPKTLKSRLAYLRSILDLPGPLMPYAGLGRAVLKRFSESEALRNLMAHARMQILPGMVTFYLFKPISGDEIRFQTKRIPENRLLLLAVETTRFSRAVRYLAYRLESERLLPPLSAAE